MKKVAHMIGGNCHTPGCFFDTPCPGCCEDAVKIVAVIQSADPTTASLVRALEEIADGPCCEGATCECSEDIARTALRRHRGET